MNRGGRDRPRGAGDLAHALEVAIRGSRHRQLIAADRSLGRRDEDAVEVARLQLEDLGTRGNGGHKQGSDGEIEKAHSIDGGGVKRNQSLFIGGPDRLFVAWPA